MARTPLKHTGQAASARRGRDGNRPVTPRHVVKDLPDQADRVPLTAESGSCRRFSAVAWCRQPRRRTAAEPHEAVTWTL
jgi:hypothetical protein